jgi:hypothetical protein
MKLFTPQQNDVRAHGPIAFGGEGGIAFSAATLTVKKPLLIFVYTIK